MSADNYLLIWRNPSTKLYYVDMFFESTHPNGEVPESELRECERYALDAYDTYEQAELEAAAREYMDYYEYGICWHSSIHPDQKTVFEQRGLAHIDNKKGMVY